MAKQQRTTGGQAGRVKDPERDGRLKANRERGINKGTTRNRKKRT
ncbi:MAG: hypothetical protein JWM77_686 [Rhodospirillales bacterium]|nr:hypothetical protein [Rhodospirillales bacterium]